MSDDAPSTDPPASGRLAAQPRRSWFPAALLPMRKALLFAGKLAVSLGLLAFLLHQARQDPHFRSLVGQPKQWPLLAAALLIVLAAVTVTIFRWLLLVRALDIPFSVGEALRLGFLGFLLNFVSLGSVGGDLFKAIFLARDRPDHRAEAVATVIADRFLGLYSLMLVASGAFLVLHTDAVAQSPELRVVARITLVSTAVGGIGLAALLTPAVTRRWLGTSARTDRAAGAAGAVVGRIVEVARVYQRRYTVILIALALGVGVHLLLSVAVFVIARGLPGPTPALGEHFAVVPLCMLAAALPLPMAGLGAFEGSLELFYRYASTGSVVVRGRGLLVALAFRVITLTIALIGVAFYLAGRREVTEVIHDAEREG